jgi:glycogen debranching enzyme
MAQHPAPPSSPEATRFVEPVVRPIVKATDLGSVQVLKQGNLYLLTDPFGDVHPDTRGLGLYEGDTRRLSCSILRVNGQRPVLLQASAGGNYHGTIQLTNPRIDRNLEDKVRPEDALASQKLGIGRHRLLDGSVLEERVEVVNYAEEGVEVELDLELAADAADIFEVRGWVRPARGRHLPIAIRPDRVTFRYDGLDDVRRGTHLVFSEPCAGAMPVDPDVAGSANAGWVRLTWHWELRPGEARELRWLAWTTERDAPEPTDGSSASAQGRTGRTDPDAVLFPKPPRVDEDRVAGSYRAWKQGFAEIRTDNELFNLAILRSAGDLRLLTNDGPGPDERYIAAGVPWFTTLFGRDALLTSFQALAVRPQLAIETLETLAAYQADDDDPERDVEPGKILHELRTGEMATNGETPHTPYFGTVDATPLWLVLLGATFDWTGDRALVDRLWPNALRALEWIDRYGDRDGDGFVEYERRSNGLENQSWKDSGDSQRFRDGRRAEAPIAPAEVQGYVYDAKRRLAEVARTAWGDEPLAAQLDAEADELAARFDAAYWVPDRGGYYALALDRDKQRVDSLCSNLGHLLWSGIVPQPRVEAIVDALMRHEVWSGWGVRTMSKSDAPYSPLSYHNGTVWPHDTAIAAWGLARYGQWEHVRRIAHALLDAAQHFGWSLPEVFAGFDRSETPFPISYPTAARPQAWAAGTPILLLRLLLGLEPDVAQGRLCVVAGAEPSPGVTIALEGVRAHGRTWDVASSDERLSVEETTR